MSLFQVSFSNPQGLKINIVLDSSTDPICIKRASVNGQQWSQEAILGSVLYREYENMKYDYPSFNYQGKLKTSTSEATLSTQELIEIIVSILINCSKKRKTRKRSTNYERSPYSGLERVAGFTTTEPSYK